MANKYRDIDLVTLPNGDILVIACDSCGAIGLKDRDVVKAPPFIAGKYTARVCLMETFAVGALPIAMTANICNELEPTGREILRGIQDELEECNLLIPITISTEKNMETTMTALGVTVLGTCKEDGLRHYRVGKGNKVYVMGIPKMGQEVVDDRGEIATISTLIPLLQWENIKEILPVGSSGIKGELDKLSAHTGLHMKFEGKIPINLEKSAGPCTAVLLFSDGPIEEDCGIPFTRIGELI
ncbi:hypothetical protein HNQ80_003339 [Anaerosolibacter carboniphilus]|uniref:PurM-like N-terminal domain-containing protein n=1 Tax=Anaerosolibacter carboniphilus TaxID=1417629 RepID=A0A841KZ19_9FIRM|nr:AIR synthase related protein [Anaerosolibacter carboniphilus]MBB6217220.1 hypothetical protein [Anaerosolibacter carboniphilus]